MRPSFCSIEIQSVYHVGSKSNCDPVAPKRSPTRSWWKFLALLPAACAQAAGKLMLAFDTQRGEKAQTRARMRQLVQRHTKHGQSCSHQCRHQASKKMATLSSSRQQISLPKLTLRRSSTSWNHVLHVWKIDAEHARKPNGPGMR